MPRRKRWTAFVVAAAVLIATPLAVVASDVFTDVPDNNVFHDDITWLADAGVTKGCNPPDNTQFCPGDNVTREQMAAFMHRLADNQVVDAGTVDGLHASDLATVARTQQLPDIANLPLEALPGYTAATTVDLTAPSVGAVVLNYSVSAHSVASDVSYRIGVSRGADCSAVDENSHAYGSVGAATPYDSAAGSVTIPVEAGASSFTLCAQTEDAPGDAEIDAASLTAIFVADGDSLPVAGQSSTSSSSGFGR